MSSAPVPPRAATTATTDGRHLRSERSRSSIVDAMLDLLREGNTNPSSTEIADRAGVTQRTVFNHFVDMDTLMAAVATRNGEHILPLVPAGDPSGSLEERIERFCAGACRVAEDSQHIRWAILTHPSGHRYGALAVQFMRDLLRERLLATFAPELDPLGPERSLALLHLLEIEIDPAVWRLRRHQNGLSADEASDAVKTVFRLVLDPLPA